MLQSRWCQTRKDWRHSNHDKYERTLSMKHGKLFTEQQLQKRIASKKLMAKIKSDANSTVNWKLVLSEWETIFPISFTEWTIFLQRKRSQFSLELKTRPKLTKRISQHPRASQSNYSSPLSKNFKRTFCPHKVKKFQGARYNDLFS